MQCNHFIRKNKKIFIYIHPDVYADYMYAHTHLCRHTHTHTHTHTHITKENFAYLSRRKENDRFLIAASLIGRF